MSDLVQELAAGVPHWEDLQQVGRTEHALHVVLGDADLPGVGVVDQAGYHAGLHPVESHHVLLCLHQPSSEHGLEVGGEAGEDALVHRELALVHLDLDVSEAVLPPENVEAGEDHVGVCGAPEDKLLIIRQLCLFYLGLLRLPVRRLVSPDSPGPARLLACLVMVVTVLARHPRHRLLLVPSVVVLGHLELRAHL